jgi:hypothetical protein
MTDKQRDSEQEDSQMTKEQWLAIRKEAAVKIDPETAEVFWGYGSVRDPYGLYELTDEEGNIGRNYFARSPESEVWVEFGDLPEKIRVALWEKQKSRLAFPAGLPTFGDLRDEEM